MSASRAIGQVGGVAGPTERALPLGGGLLLIGALHAVPRSWEAWHRYQALTAPQLSGPLEVWILSVVVPVLIGIWPLVVAFGVLHRSRSRWLGVAAVTFLALAADGVSTLLLGWGFGLEEARRRYLDVLPESWKPSLVAVHAVLAFGLGVQAWRRSRPRRPAAAGDGDHATQRQAILGRLTTMVAIIFAFALIISQLWNIYVEIVTRSTWARELVLATEAGDTTRRSRDRLVTPEARQARQVWDDFTEANVHLRAERYLQARRAYARGLERLYTLLREDAVNPGAYDDALAFGSNNLAWLLVTGPNPGVLDPERAVELAKTAVELAPANGNYWNTLGVAYYRAGDDTAALAVFREAMRLRSGQGDSFDWFFLAMIHAERGQFEPAHAWFDRAVAWTERHRPFDPELRRFWAEAAAVLGVPGPAEAPPAAEPVTVGNGTDFQPRTGPNR